MTSAEKWTAWGVVVAVVSVVIAVFAWLLPVKDSPATTTSGTGTISGQSGGGDDAGGATVAPAPTENDSGSQVKTRSGTITISEGHSVVLDTNSPNWNVHNGCASCSLWFQNDLSAGYGGDLAVLSSGDTGSYETCSSATQYEHTVKHDDITPGLRMCVRTPTGKFALVQVTAFHDPDSYEDDYVKLAVTSRL